MITNAFYSLMSIQNVVNYCNFFENSMNKVQEIMVA